MAVIVLGSINLDLVARVDQIPGPGDTRLAHELSVSAGGKGANQALAARRMGAATIFLGTVGNDAFARQAVTELSHDGVNLAHLQTESALPTGIAMITVDSRGQNAITVADGANRATGDSALASLDQMVERADYVVLQNEIPLSTVERAVHVAHRHQATVIWDPAPALPRPVRGLLGADIVIPNQREAESLLGARIEDVRTAKAMARQLKAEGPEVVVIKLGSQGVVWATLHGVFYLPAIAVKAIDTVGAGDVFAGSLAARLDAGDGLAEAMGWANVAAGLSTTGKGAQPSFPYWEAVRKYAGQQRPNERER